MLVTSRGQRVNFIVRTNFKYLKNRLYVALTNISLAILFFSGI